MLGIFSVEAQWQDATELSAKPMLDALVSYGCGDTKLNHHVAKPGDKLEDHLLKWDKEDAEWCFVHLWFHGSQGSISVDR